MHILGEMVNKAAGVNIAPRARTRAWRPAVNDVLGGHVPLTYITYGPVAPHLPSGKMLPLAVADRTRSPLAPNVPTLRRAGLQGRRSHGLARPLRAQGPAARDREDAQRPLQRDPQDAGRGRRRWRVLGALPLGGAPEALAKTNAADFERFGKIIKELGIQAD